MSKIITNKYARIAFQILLLAVGSAIICLGYNCFYTPHDFTPSGFSGLATILSVLLSRVGINIGSSIIYLGLNVILVILAFIFFGWKFAIMTLMGIGIFTLCLEYVYIPALVPADPTISALVGGAIVGVGGGIIFRSGGCTGGSDVVVLLLNKYFPNIKTGQCSMIINLVVIVLSVITFGINCAFYTIVAIFIAGKMMDTILNGSKGVRAFYIICDKEEAVAEKILQTFNRGVTKLNAEGAFSHKQKTMLLCLVTNEQARRMKLIVHEADPNSFMFSTSVREAMGETMFIREVSQRKHQLLNAQIDLKTENKFAHAKQTRLSKRNKLKYVKPHKKHLSKA